MGPTPKYLQTAGSRKAENFCFPCGEERGSGFGGAEREKYEFEAGFWMLILILNILILNIKDDKLY